MCITHVNKRVEDEHSRKVSIKRSGLTFKCKNIYDGEIYTHHIGNVYAKVQRHSDTPLERDRKHTNIHIYLHHDLSLNGP